MNEFEQWALSPNGGNWAFYPTKETATEETLIRWEDEKIAFNAAIKIERERLRKLVEAEIFENVISAYSLGYNDSLKEVLNWLTDPTETDKTASND